MRSALAFALLLAGCPAPANDDDDDTPSPSGSLDVLTYNVHGLPPTLAGDDPEARMPLIVPRLEPFDVVGLQEVWMDGFYDTLAVASHPSQVRHEGALPGRLYGAGLATFARVPVLAIHSLLYSACNGTTDGAGDCLASKGALAVRLDLGGVELDVWDTHFEAGGGAADVAARQTHADELSDAIADWSGDRALVLTGDFNLHPWRDPEDVLPWETLVSGAGLTDTCEATECVDAEHIDRVLFRSSARLELSASSWENLEQDFMYEGGELSDHPPIATQIDWAAR